MNSPSSRHIELTPERIQADQLREELAEAYRLVNRLANDIECRRPMAYATHVYPAVKCLMRLTLAVGRVL